MRATAILAFALGLLIALRAVPALAQMHQAPPPADHRPGSPSVAPPSQQREMTRPAGSAVAPTTGSVDQRGPAAVQRPNAEARLQTAIETKEAQLRELQRNPPYRSKIEASYAELKRRRDDAAQKLLAERQVLIKQWESSSSYNRGSFEDVVIAPLNARFGKVNEDFAKMQAILQEREAKFKADWERDVAQLSADVARDRQGLVDLQESKARQAKADAELDALRTRLEIKRMREQADELDRRANEIAGQNPDRINPERAAMPLYDQATDLRSMVHQMERRQQGLAPQGPDTTTLGVLNSTIDSMGRAGGR